MGQRASRILDRRADERRTDEQHAAKQPGSEPRRRSLHFPLARSARGSSETRKGRHKVRPMSLVLALKRKRDTIDVEGEKGAKQRVVEPEKPSVPESAQALAAPTHAGAQPDVPTTKHARLRVAIAGGGIGGLALATFLASHNASDLEVIIYESAPSLTELGAGVGVWLRTWRILSSIFFADGSEGLADGLTRIAPAGRDMNEGMRKAFEFRKGDGGREGVSFYTMMVPFSVLTLHRADFQQVLARHAFPPATVQFRKRLIGYGYTDENDTSSEIVLRFADGSTARADVLVGADGIRSATRGEMYRRLARKGELGDALRAPDQRGVPARVEDLSKPPAATIKQTVSPGVLAKSSIHPVDALAKTVYLQTPQAAVLVSTPLNGSADASKTNGVLGVSRARINGQGHGLDPVSDLIEPVWSGTFVYRHLISLAALERRFPGHRAGKGPVVYFGKNKHVIAFPIAHTAPGADGSISTTPMVNLVAFTSDPAREGTRIAGAWVRSAARGDLLTSFAGWEDEVQALLELAENPLLWAIHTVKPLPRYSDADGRVVLLGDAAHAMTPHQGAGGGQAIEDAHVLAALLADARVTRGTLPAALRAYDAVRIPVSREVVRTSRLNGMMYEFNHGWADGAPPAAPPQANGVAHANADAETPQPTAGEREEKHAELLRRLRAHAEAIMEIHKWEWADATAESQPQQAVRILGELLAQDRAKVDASE